MARPLKKGMTYFPHDTDAVNDEKIEAMRGLYGNDGYSFYFIILERIYRTETGELDISSEIKKAAIIRKIGVDNSIFENMLDSSLEIGLFDKNTYSERGFLTSNGVRNRLDEVNTLRRKWRNKKVFSGENTVDNAEKIQQKTGEKEKEIKKETKKEIKISKTSYADFVTLTSDEYQKLITQFGEHDTKEKIRDLDFYKGSTGKKYASDYLTILSWDRKNTKGSGDKSNGFNSPDSKATNIPIFDKSKFLASTDNL